MTRTPGARATLISSTTQSAGSSMRRRPLLVGEVEPAITDEGQQHVTAADGPAYIVGEVDPGRNGVDVHEELELLAQPVPGPARDVLGVGAPIAQEDFDPAGHGVILAVERRPHRAAEHWAH